MIAVQATKRDKRNNPLWECLGPLEITRLDHSLTMGEHAGEISHEGKVLATVTTVWGGFVYCISVRSADGKSEARYAVDLAPTLKAMVEKHAEFVKAETIKPPEAKPPKSKRRK